MEVFRVQCMSRNGMYPEETSLLGAHLELSYNITVVTTFYSVNTWYLYK